MKNPLKVLMVYKTCDKLMDVLCYMSKGLKQLKVNSSRITFCFDMPIFLIALNSLTHIGGHFFMVSMLQLVSLKGFENLRTIGGCFEVVSTFATGSENPFRSLQSVGQQVNI